MPEKNLETQVTSEQEGRVDRVIQQLTGKSRKDVRGLIDHGKVTVNGTPCDQDFMRVQEGDLVQVQLDPHTRLREKAKPWHDPAFRLVYEDDDLIVVDKAAHVLTVPTSEEIDRQTNTLIDAVSRYLSRGGRKNRRAFVAHRLDRGVSGLLVMGKSQVVSQMLRDQFADHKPHRRYVAIVAGKMTQQRGTFQSYLATGTDLSRYSTHDVEQGQYAVTHFEVQGTLQPKVGPLATLVHVELETGRRNQIRVHFAEANHPVLGDPRYQSRHAKHPQWNARRLALHAAELGFTQPQTGERLMFKSPLPPEMARFIRGATKKK